MRIGFRIVFFCAGLIFIGALTAGCDYARMREDEAVEYDEMALPAMPAGIVPRDAGAELAPVDPLTLANPLEPSGPVIAAGKEAYGYYCIHCHGPGGDGHGTVGQSFAPLPISLKSPYVQQQPDGSLFYRIAMGFKRHPPLAYTVSPEDRWAVIHYMRSLARAEQPSSAR